MSEIESEGGESCVSRVFLIAFNLVYLAFAIFLIWLGVYVDGSGWLDVFQDRFPWLQATSMGTLVGVGSVLAMIALLGIIGAITQKRALLNCYVCIVLFVLALFVALMVVGFIARSTATDYQAQAFPASNVEPDIAFNFNKIYCSSYGIYLCTTADPSLLIKSLVPSLATFLPTDLLGEVKGINGLCNFAKKQNPDILDQTPDAQRVCDTCQGVKGFQKYNKIYDWSEEQCSITDSKSSLAWCTAYLAQGVDKPVFEGAPYAPCRQPFLDLWKSTASTVAFIALFISASIVLLVLFSCCSRRKSRMARVERNSSIEYQL